MDADEDSYVVPPYNCNDTRLEPRPDSIVYKPQFEELRSSTSQVVDLMRGPLQDSPYHNNITNGLLREVEKRTNDKAPDNTMFAVAGDMAAGKSSVINSILSVGTIARKGDGGKSCTWVVQRFMKTFSDQTTPFAARVHFFNMQEVREIVKSLLRKYWHACSRDYDQFSESEVSGQKDYSDIRTVMDSFVALFADRDEFLTEDHATKFLATAVAEDDERILETLVEYAGKVWIDHLNGQPFITVSAKTVQNLLFALQPYTYILQGDEGTRTASPWPLVSVIDFGLDHPILMDGIVLVDSPGLTDSNSTRADNAVRHHRQCAHKITVAEITRAENDNDLRENLFQGYRLRGSGNTILVLTHGDDIDPETGVVGSGLEKKREQILWDECEELEHDRRSLRIQRARSKGQKKHDITDRLDQLNATAEEKERELFALRVKLRNRSVLRELKKQYHELTGDPCPLSAFVVGNEAYKKHVAGYDFELRPTLTVEETGIPALRKRLFELPAESKLNDALHLATVQLPNLLISFELYCARTHMSRRAEIEAIILRPQAVLPSLLGQTFEKTRDNLKSTILDPIDSGENEWIGTARNICQGWATTYRKDYLTLLKKEGFRNGNKNSDSVNWNAELNRIMEEAIVDCFGSFLQTIGPLLEEAWNEFTKMLDKTRMEIRKDPQFNLLALQNFLKSFEAEKPDARKRITVAVRGLKRKVGMIQEETLARSGYSYMSKAMQPIYEGVRQIKGRGAPAKRPVELEKAVAQPSGVWMRVRDSVEDACLKVVDECEKSISHDLSAVFDSINDNFSFLCDNAEARDEGGKVQESALREQLQKNVIVARELVDGPIRELATACKEYKQKSTSTMFVEGD